MQRENLNRRRLIKFGLASASLLLPLPHARVWAQSDGTLKLLRLPKIALVLGIPQQIAFQSLPTQERAIRSQIDITKFKDPKFVENFTQRYLIAAGAASTTNSTVSTLSTLAIQAQGLVV